jgi:hypothetical protein
MRNWRWTLALAAVLGLVLSPGCGRGGQRATPTTAPEGPTSEPTETAWSTDTAQPTETAQPTNTPEATPTETAEPPFDGHPLPMDQDKLFAASGVCASCHTGLVDEAGNDVSNDTNWRAAIMANAARDPYWQATVRSEVLELPHLKAAIEDKCATCHTPMARFGAAHGGLDTALLDGGFLDPDHAAHGLAIDGVSCTLCHQVEETGLGTPEGFSGGFVVDVELPPGGRLAYGPFPAAEGPAAVMREGSGYLPLEGPQTTQSELCATCHTLYTPYVDADGEIAGEFPEQVPYLEWRHSDYAETHVCQDCHMPPAEGEVQIASIGGGPPRSPFAQHLFIGGNAYVLEMLRTFGEEWAVTASSEHFQRKIDQTLEQLQERTATVAVEQAEVDDSGLVAVVAVRNEAGHKLPTGFPARRVWLHVTVTDAAGGVVFESGAVEADGSIVGNENDSDPAGYEAHHEELTSPDQVQIYEAILENIEGAITTGLLRAQGYRKDNRLLPTGFDKGTADADFGVYGAAADDGDFQGGGDRVRYAIDVGDASGPFTVEVELLYQSIGARWAENLRRHDAPEIASFLGSYEAVPNQPVVVAVSTVTVEP